MKIDNQITTGAISDKMHEGELAFVIGRKCKNVTKDEALDHIGGVGMFLA